MRLKNLLVCLEYVMLQHAEKLSELETTGICYDSREAKEGDLFVCISGEKEDGHQYLHEVAEKGITAVLIEKLTAGGETLKFPADMAVILVGDTREALAYLSAAYFGYPAKKLKVIGVTGTKGKTTVTYMIRELLEEAGHRTGLMGTVEVAIGEKRAAMKNTTPESFTIHEYFAKMVEAGCEYVVMEVSSQAVKHKRTEGIEFEAGVFTNLGNDHIGTGEHENFAEYKYFKSLFFEQCKIGIGNIDDMWCSDIFSHKRCEKYGFTCQGKGNSRIMAASQVSYEMKDKALMTRFRTSCGEVLVSMPGLFNVYNALAALRTVQCLGIPAAEVKDALSRVQVRGRMEHVSTEKRIACYIDYAHNAMSLENVLRTMRAYEPEHLIVVFGCGGNRSKERRARMGEVAGSYADLTIVTSDNPRMEEPLQIIEDIVEGLEETGGKYEVICDRADAVRYAVSEAKCNDIVIIAGKGHEAYQEIQGVCYPMDDRELIGQADRSCQVRD